MLLRSITKHVKDQNWFAVGLDFFIVVFGVFIGLQVQQWSEGQSEAAQELEILQSIADDLSSDRPEYAAGRAFAMSGLRAANYLLQEATGNPVDDLVMPATNIPQVNNDGALLMLPSQSAPTANERQRLWSMIMVTYNPQPGTVALESLVATGKLGIIKDKEFVADLQDYRDVTNGLSGSQDSSYRPIRNQALSIGLKQGLSAFSAIPPKDLIKLTAENPELAAAIRLQTEYTVIHLSQIEEADKRAADLLDSLRAMGVE